MERMNYHPVVLGHWTAEIQADFPEVPAADLRIVYITSYHDRPYAGVAVYRERLCAFLILEENLDTDQAVFVLYEQPRSELEHELYPILWWWLLDERGQRYPQPPPRPYWFEAFWDTTPAVRQPAILGWYRTIL